MIIRVENFKEHCNQISLSSEASFHGSDTLHKGCLKCFKHENIADLLQYFCCAYKRVDLYSGKVGIFGILRWSKSTRNMQRQNARKMEILLQRNNIE